MKNSENILDIKESVLKKSWVIRPQDENKILAIKSKYKIPDLIVRILMNRGVRSNDIEYYLNPTLKHSMPDPYVLIDMDKSCNRIKQAIVNNEKIGIIGDYDVDGAVSTSVLYKYLNSLSNIVHTHIPDRIKEGYGPSVDSIKMLIKKGVTLLISVDCGTSSNDIFKSIESNIDIIVLDHHQPSEFLPDVYAVVNPNRLDDSSGLGFLCASGVVFLTLVALNRILREDKYFNNIKEPNLLNYLQLIAMATITDVVPLVGLNRALVHQGLKLINKNMNEGLKAIAGHSSIYGEINAYHFGYVFGPRINAGGRIGKSDLGLRLLIADDPVDADSLAFELNELNLERQRLESQYLDEAITCYESKENSFDSSIVFVSSKNWHPGVIGIIASRLVERYNKPALVMTYSTITKAYTGSGRSVKGFDLGLAVKEAYASNLLVKGGGHEMAAGFTVKEDNLSNLEYFFNKLIHNDIIEIKQKNKSTVIDSILVASGANVTLVEWINKLEPFGNSFRSPRFIFISHKISYIKIVGDSHLKLTISSFEGKAIEAMAFRAISTPLGDALLSSKDKKIHFIGKLNINEWNGRKIVQLIIEDIAYPN
ncbi:single-stranded-DNA-specific exonuclease RecJ [Hyphomicrobiales bacterium]|jgi:single-stranded-DNA-specific exonuclease|nr:single-stranded-DNA-specific exonuclease RecJ [Hyphomicrobiales bacterium]